MDICLLPSPRLPCISLFLLFFSLSLHSFPRPFLFSPSQGIYSDPECSLGNVDHAVIVVGYDLTGPVPYWIIMNSWGSDWGMNVSAHWALPRARGCWESKRACSAVGMKAGPVEIQA